MSTIIVCTPLPCNTLKYAMFECVCEVQLPPELQLFGMSDCAALLQLCVLSCRIADMLSGKGGGKGGKFQGKCQKLENRGAVEQLLRETVEK